MKSLDKDTTVCISISARPGTMGTALHNAAYRALGLNFLYKAFAVTDLAGAIAGVRALGIRGCSVSMPFKESVVPLLDAVDRTAKMIGAVNTIVNTNGRLVGYNTDAAGARQILRNLGVKPNHRVLLLGAGGAARAVFYALKNLKIRRVFVSARRLRKARQLVRGAPDQAIPWNHRNDIHVDVLINATPIGMNPNPEACPVGGPAIRNCDRVFDLVASPPETALVKRARSYGKRVAGGLEMGLYQAAEQFRLYTGVIAPLVDMQAALRRHLGRS